jgi:hypothetical protein
MPRYITQKARSTELYLIISTHTIFLGLHNYEDPFPLCARTHSLCLWRLAVQVSTIEYVLRYTDTDFATATLMIDTVATSTLA